MSIFSIQTYLEDFFERRGLSDVDRYAIRVANAYEGLESSVSEKAVAAKLGKIRTTFYRRNGALDRQIFEATLASDLRKKFKKKRDKTAFKPFEKALAPIRAKFKAKRRTISALLADFKGAVESRAVDSFWNSRKSNKLRIKPEKIAQDLLSVFAQGVLKSKGFVLQEFASGIGFVDVGISFGGILHLIEMKILKGPLKGVNQLARYMKTERRRSGWLVLIDTRKQNRRAEIPLSIQTSVGQVLTVVIDVNPLPPHDE